MTTSKKDNRGFTIIEVVLVLAIAGLIFLIVFLALPQLQRSRRDTQRQSDAGRMLAAMESFAGKNNGSYPDLTTGNAVTNTGTVITSYLTKNGGVFSDPSTNSYTVVETVPAAEGEIQVIHGTCDGPTVDTTGATAGNVAVAVYQEAGENYCQDNQ